MNVCRKCNAWDIFYLQYTFGNARSVVSYRYLSVFALKKIFVVRSRFYIFEMIMYDILKYDVRIDVNH